MVLKYPLLPHILENNEDALSLHFHHNCEVFENLLLNIVGEEKFVSAVLSEIKLDFEYHTGLKAPPKPDYKTTMEYLSSIRRVHLPPEQEEKVEHSWNNLVHDNYTMKEIKQHRYAYLDE